MRLLVVDNGWVLMNRKVAITEPRSRDFLHGCSEHFDAVLHLCASPRLSPNGCEGVALDPDRVRTIPVPVRGARRWARLLSYVRHVGVVWRAIRESDFLYVFFPGNAPLASVGVSRLLGKPYGVYLRGELGRNSWWWRWTMSGARFVIAEGEVLAGAARRFCDDVELSVPMCPLPKIVPDRKKSIRTEGPWRLLYVGRLEERKGTPELLEAMALLDRRRIDFRLDLVGPNGLDRLPEHVAVLGDRIHCVGMVTDDDLLGRYYAEADLFCLPSHDEGFPRVLYEAMIYGVPIVTTFVGSIAGIMKDGVNCLRVDVRSPAALADTIERALADAELRRRLRDNGRATMEPICRQSDEHGHAKQLAAKIRACRLRRGKS